MSSAFARITTFTLFGFSAGTAAAYICRPLFSSVSLTLRTKGYSWNEAQGLTINLVELGIIGFMVLGSALGASWTASANAKSASPLSGPALKRVLFLAALVCIAAAALLALTPPLIIG